MAVDLCCIKAVVGDAFPRFHETGSHKDRTHSGWPPCSTPAQDRFIALIAHRNQFRTAILLKGEMVARFGSRCTNIHCKTQLYFVLWIPVQIAEKKKSFLSSAGDSWNRKPGRLCEAKASPVSSGIFRKPQLIFVFQGDNAPPHTFILVEECGMDIESAFPPHAMAPIFSRYKHNRCFVGFTNKNIICGSSATIEQLKQRVEQHCYKVPCVASIRKCHSTSIDYGVCVVILPNTNPWYHMNELTP